METKDFIPLISVTVVVIGWFVNNLFSRRHEIAKKRLEYRLEALKSFLPVWFSMQKHEAPFIADPELLTKIENSRSNIQLYGNKQEIEAMENFIKHLESGDIKNSVASINRLVILIKASIRKELKLGNS
jgi:hypothetical protein